MMENKTESVDFKMNDRVDSVYARVWYIGQITEVDDDDCYIIFFVKAGKYGNAYKF